MQEGKEVNIPLSVWYRTLWMFNSSILFYIHRCLQTQARGGQSESLPSWEHCGCEMMCWTLCGNCRSNLGCTHWVPSCSRWCGCGLCIAACSELCMYEQYLALSVTLKWSLLYSVPISQLGLKKENGRSEINTAAKILPWRTSYCDVLWEGNWSVIGKPIMAIQVLHLWHTHVVAVSMKVERKNLHFLCRRTGKTKPCCDKRMDFAEQNHWGFEDIFHGWDHQLAFQVSAKRGWKYHETFQKAFRNQLCLRGLWVGKLPIELLPTNGLWSSSKAGRL